MNNVPTLPLANSGQSKSLYDYKTENDTLRERVAQLRENICKIALMSDDNQVIDACQWVLSEI